MAFQYLQNIAQGFREGQRRREEQMRLEAQKQANEQKKLEIEATKIGIADKEAGIKAQKSVAETKQIQTDTLGKELQNKVDKFNILNPFDWFGAHDEQPSMWKGDPAGAAKKNLAGVKRATPEEEKNALASLPAPKPAASPAPGKQGQAKGLPPLPSLQLLNPDAIGVTKLPKPPTYDTKRFIQALDAMNREILDGVSYRENLFEQQKIITQEFTKAGNTYREGMRQNLQLSKQLLSNPPTYASALANLSTIRKVIGVMDAGMNGYLRANPLQLLDSFVEQELSDQMMRFKAGQAYISKRETMFEQFYNLSKSEAEAQSSTLALLYKGVADQIQGFEKVATNEQQIMSLRALNKEVQYKAGVQQAKLLEAAKSRAFKGAMKAIDVQMKAQSGSGLPGVDRKDTIRIGKKRRFYLASKEKAKFKESLSTAKKTMSDLDNVESLVKGVKITDALSGITSLISDKGRAARARIKTINRTLRGLAGQARVAIAGPGALSDQEREVLEKYFEVKKEGDWMSLIAPLGGRVWAGVRRGDYEAMIRALRKKVTNDVSITMGTTIEDLRDMSNFERYNLAKEELAIR